MRPRVLGLASVGVAVGSDGVFLWALSLGAMGAVAARREARVMFAAGIGAPFLGERVGPVRLGMPRSSPSGSC